MKHYTHLSTTGRRRLYTYLEMGIPLTEIAKKLSKSRSTIYREVKRNKTEEGSYLPILAQQQAEERAKHGRRNKLRTDGHLRAYVVQALKKGWSPEQISGRMKYNQLSYYVCAETIYRYIYNNPKEELYGCLVNKKAKRRKRHHRKERHCRYGEIRLITQRPEEIASRKRFGHWEGDTIEFRGTKEKIVTTLVERKSRTVFLLKNWRKYSDGVMTKIKKKFATLPEKMFQTITFDQGSEFAAHKILERSPHCRVYYCETHSAWQKGVMKI